ncbi:MAG: hypothetical protein LBI74_04125 [Synergistaceae bacterium]|jgi:hypothetical protein|nr:hypothetical protein [Synergistaceae bacterium]
MEKKNNWFGKEENTSIEYEILSERTIQTNINEFDFSTYVEDDASVIKADRWDCLIAASSGFLTGMLDIFWVGEFSLVDVQSQGKKLTNELVIKIAQSRGYTKNTLDGAIRFLEKMYPNPSDKIAAEYGGGLQHHLRDFSHHPTSFGLICSILTQFTSMGHGTDTDGRYLSTEIHNSNAIGNTFEEKILFGVVNTTTKILN